MQGKDYLGDGYCFNGKHVAAWHMALKPLFQGNTFPLR